jgi:hypothetical protein
MRFFLALSACVAALSASSASLARDPPGWSYAYAAGVATATERDERGRVIATLSCRPPTGDIVLSDFALARYGRDATNSAVRIGETSINVPSRVEGRGRNRALVINLPQRPPILAGIRQDDQLSVTVGNQSRTYFDGGPKQLHDIAFACWGR